MADDSSIQGTAWRTRRVAAMRAAVALCLVAIGVKLWVMQTIQHARWVDESLQALTKDNAIPAARGIVYDRNGKPFASNEPQWAAVVTPKDVMSAGAELAAGDKGKRPAQKELFANLALRLAEVINSCSSRQGPSPAQKPIDPQKTLQTMNDIMWAPYKSTPVAQNLDHETVMRVKERSFELPGVDVERKFLRRYDHPDGSNAFHLLGYVGPISEEERGRLLRPDYGYELTDLIGKCGVENYYEAELRGRKGREVILPNGPPTIDRLPRPGHDLTLNVDSSLQTVAEESLARNVEKFNGDSGAAIAMDPQTGAIYAMASYPSFRGEWFLPEHAPESAAERKRVEDDRPTKRLPYSNQAISSQRAPASTFKLVTLAAALEEGVIDPDTYAVYCTGSVMLGSTPRHCWQKHGHGAVGVIRSLCVSCNIFYYSLGVRLKERRLVNWAKAFGFGEQTGIDLPGEGKGIVGDRAYLINVLGEDGWFDGHSAIFAIGHGTIQATPIQVALMTAIIANGGRRVVPTVVAAITESGRPQSPIRPAKTAGLVPLSPRTLDIVRAGMRGVVLSDEGTAHRAFSGENELPVAVAGKTGSSEIGTDDAWFTCYAPYAPMDPSDPESVSRAAMAPQLVVTVLVVNGGHGADSAAPVAHDIIRAAYDDRGRFRIGRITAR